MSEHNCKLISDVTVISSGKVLLVKYKDGNKYDHQDGWFLPDDLLKYSEDPHESSLRILNEQLGLIDADVILAFVESFSGKDSSWHIVFHYKINLYEGAEIRPSEEIREYEWFEFSALPERKEVAHNGWALFTLSETLK